LPDTVVENDHRDLRRRLLALKHCLELIGVVRKPQATQRIHILALRSFVIKEHISTIAGKVSNNKVRNHYIGVKIIG
jgi:hypothetical protein